MFFFNEQQTNIKIIKLYYLPFFYRIIIHIVIQNSILILFMFENFNIKFITNEN